MSMIDSAGPGWPIAMYAVFAIDVAHVCMNLKVCSGHGTCLGLSGYCSCYKGYSGASCSVCSPSHASITRSDAVSCVFLPGAMTSCNDGVRNGNEEGVDCGGPVCSTSCGEDSATRGAAWMTKASLEVTSHKR